MLKQVRMSDEPDPDDVRTSPTAIADAVRALARARPELDLVERADLASDPAPDIDRRVEALLFASDAPVTAAALVVRLPEGADVGGALARLKRRYVGRGVVLVEVAGGWRFQTAPDLAYLMEERREEPKKLSRAALETLAIIAYHQPCTRSDIEEVRGVAVGRGTLDLLMEIGWVRAGARRQTPGKPLTYKTTNDFLSHFNMARLDDLPGKADLQAQGLLDARLPPDFEVPRPMASVDMDDDGGAADDRDDDSDFTKDFFEP
jgi:segregation and condensation protein B